MNRAHFKIGLNWPEMPGADEPDLANVTMSCGETIFTHIIDTESQSTRNYFTTSALQLGFWFAKNFWRLRWESLANPSMRSITWRLRHEMSSISGGILWPPIMIYSAGQRVVFAPIGKEQVPGPQQYVEPFVTSVSGHDYEIQLDQMFATIARKCASLADGRTFKTLLEQLNAERADVDVAAWRRLEARLGYDLDEAPDEVMNGLIEFETVVGDEGVEEAAAAVPGHEAVTSLCEAINAARHSEVDLGLDILSHVQIPKDDIVRRTPWQLAEEAAEMVRETVNLNHRPILNKKLADILGTSVKNISAPIHPDRPLRYAAALKRANGRLGVASIAHPGKNRRYELARTLGDAIWTRGAGFGVISQSRTDRQKFQRAFARSLLCPFEDLRNIVDESDPTEAQIDHASKHFHVHENVVKSVLVYKGVLPSMSFEDRLEAA